MDQKIRDQLKLWEEQGYGNLPVCMAKTQYSFSTDPNLRGAPTGHSVPVREVRLSAGAGFIVAVCGEIMTMPVVTIAVDASVRQAGATMVEHELKRLPVVDAEGCLSGIVKQRGHRLARIGRLEFET